jgi:hypothetical protein
MTGKGSTRRPAQVTAEAFAENWERTFGNSASTEVDAAAFFGPCPHCGGPGHRCVMYSKAAHAPGQDGYEVMVEETKANLERVKATAPPTKHTTRRPPRKT